MREPDDPSAGGDVLCALRDVHFAYGAGSPLVLGGVSVEIERGSVVGLVGPSGCGKSTLLYLLAELYAPTGGAIVGSMHEGSGSHPLTMVFQKDTLLPWLTVAENVRLFARFKRGRGGRRGRLRDRAGAAATRADLDERVMSLLRTVHLEDRADAYPHQLSGGMRRRLQFLSAVAPNPMMLLLDEPFSSVDEPTRIGIHQDVFDATRGMHMTVMLVTHDLAEAISLCDRVLILSNRPARIAHVHEIPFGRERNMLELRGTSQYLDCYGRLWDDLTAQIAAGGAASIDDGAAA